MFFYAKGIAGMRYAHRTILARDFLIKVSLFEVSFLGRVIKGIMKFIHPLILSLAVLTLPVAYFRWVYSRNKAGVLHDLPVLPLSICIYFTALYTIFAPWPRYGIPLRPELYLCAMWALTFFTRILGNRWRTSDAYS